MKKLCDKLFRYNSVMENAEHTNRYYKKKKDQNVLTVTFFNKAKENS